MEFGHEYNPENLASQIKESLELWQSIIKGLALDSDTEKKLLEKLLKLQKMSG